MKDPSPIQQKAIKHLLGPALIIAGPGSGKTFTIINRISYLTQYHGVSSEHILVITYTKAAAHEMQERYKEESHMGHVQFGTFHSICYQILIQSGTFSSQSLISEHEKRVILQMVLRNQGLSEKTNYDNCSEILHQMSRLKNLSIESTFIPTIQISDFSPIEFINIQHEYEALLAEQCRMDFDDMIGKCLLLLHENSNILHQYQNLFQYILVDEFQDINPPQYAILKLLSGSKQNIFAVGDDDQAIYGFRGATPNIMQQFLRDYPNAIQIFLTENYRSGESIIHFSNQVIIQNQNRFTKEFKAIRSGGLVTQACFESRTDEEKYISKILLTYNQRQCSDTAVILRTNFEAVQYLELLKKQAIPVKEKLVDENNLLESFILSDFMAFIAYLYEGNKRSDFLQFMNKPNRNLTRMALPFETVSSAHIMKYYTNNETVLVLVKQLFGKLSLAANLNPFLSISYFRNILGYDEYLKNKSANQQQYDLWIHQAQAIQELLKGYGKKQKIADYISQIKKEQVQKYSIGTYSTGVSVLTMHSSKGLEFKNVFLPDINEGIIPSRKCITPEDFEEERRLLYVAITRAKMNLSIYYTNERNRNVSRFIEAIIPHQNHQHPLIHRIP